MKKDKNETLKPIIKEEETALQKVDNSNSMLQMADINSMKSWYDNFVNFSKEILKEGLDYGVIPGVSKPSLFKPGAEKLRFVYGLGVEVNLTDKLEDLNRNYLDYTYKAVVKTKNGQILAECEGNANSYESKWRYTWVNTTKKPSKAEGDDLKARGIGKWSKKGDNFVWVEKQENNDIVGMKNTLMKMAQKRAFVGAMLIATGASEFFTQDVEDMETFGSSNTIIVDDSINNSSAVGNVINKTNQFKNTLDLLLRSNTITQEEYDDVIFNEEDSRKLIKDIKDKRDAKISNKH